MYRFRSGTRLQIIGRESRWVSDETPVFLMELTNVRILKNGDVWWRFKLMLPDGTLSDEDWVIADVTPHALRSEFCLIPWGYDKTHEWIVEQA